MRIVVSIEADGGLEASVSQHFGHCPYFAVVDVEGGQVNSVRTINNPYYPQHQPGAIPQFVHSQGANVMLTGGMGARAVAFFEQFGIEAVTGASGTVQGAVDAYLRGDLTGVAPCLESASHDCGKHQ